MNRSLSAAKGGKSLATYSDLMGGAMREISRVLKPGGWATVVFHNTDRKIWQAIRDAADGAGFTFHEAASLDRRQQSHKGYKGRSGSENVAHFDVVFNLCKAEQAAAPTEARAKAIDLAALVGRLARDPDVARRGLQGVHAEVMRRLASDNGGQFVNYADIRRLWEEARAQITEG